MKASKEVKGKEIIIAARSDDFFATSDTITIIEAVIINFIK
tara:strand:+ start:705 stop:827 length:123 start_codon:yes stop_codon:yes gene_type:complete